MINEKKKTHQSYLRTTKVGVAARFLFEITVGTVIWYFGELNTKIETIQMRYFKIVFEFNLYRNSLCDGQATQFSNNRYVFT
jgi:hypothetical protein